MDEPLSVADIESFGDLSNDEKAEMIATLLTVMVLDTNKGVRVYNFNNENKVKPLATEKIWSNRWKQMNDQEEFVSIDLGKVGYKTDPLTLILAAKIEAFYQCDSGRSLADDALLDARNQNIFLIY